MKNNKKTAVTAGLMALVIALAATGCASQDVLESEDKPSSQLTPDLVYGSGYVDPGDEDPDIVSDISDPEVIVTEAIIEHTQEGDAENPYYRITNDENGVRVYEVTRASDGEIVQLPTAETILYLSDGDNYRYEQVKFTYKLNGEEMELEQYSLYVLNPDLEEINEASDNVDIDVVDSEAADEDTAG